MKKEQDASAIEECKLLHERFNHVTSLRVTTARRYGIIFGAIIAFIAVSINQGLLKELDLETQSKFVFWAAFVMQMLGISVLTYDWKIRARASQIAEDIRESAERTSLNSKLNDGLDEDRWFVGELFISNAFISTLLLASFAVQFLKITTISELPEWFLFSWFVLFIGFIFGYFKLWKYRGILYRERINSWLPG